MGCVGLSAVGGFMDDCKDSGGGGNGNILKSWIPCRYVSADILGLMWVGRIMLRGFFALWGQSTP